MYCLKITKQVEHAPTVTHPDIDRTPQTKTDYCFWKGMQPIAQRPQLETLYKV